MNIIGKPPAPKRGATFVDVPVGGLFEVDGTRWVRLAVFAFGAGPRNARLFGAVTTDFFGDDTPVTLLDVTPREPEPDPAVTTYGELRAYMDVFVFLPEFSGDTPRKGLFRVDGSGGLLQLNGCPLGRPLKHLPVRRVPASVVIHKEPGTHVYPDGGGARIEHWGHSEVIGSHSVSIEQLRAVVQQGAALLAQQAASPESEPPHCQETGKPCKQACATICKKTGLDVEAAEDRSKPAPGYVIGLPGGRPWTVSEIGGGCLRSTHPTRDEAVARTWEMHDAQQAEKGGDS